MKNAVLALAASMILASPLSAEPSWSPGPWVEDVAAIKSAMDTKYANRDWLAGVRGIDLDAALKHAAEQIEAADSDAAARAIIDRTLIRFHDGHVQIDWPDSGSAGRASGGRETVCASLGFSDPRPPGGIGPALPGYVAVGDGGTFPAGTATIGRHTIGVLRISEFQPQGTPELCRLAERSLGVDDEAPCDADCRDRLMDEVYAGYTKRLKDQLAALRSTGSGILVVDLTNNGGGSEWAEAAARMLVARPLRSEALGFVRGEHWERRWQEVAEKLVDHASTASAADQVQLGRWIAQARAAARQARTSCVFGSGCAWLGRAGYATGLVGRASAKEFRGKPWGPIVFSPAGFDYEDGLWNGPLIVLVNDGTGSAAEEFAAVLQDNRAAVIVGARTAGAGCGHTDGGTPTTLPHGGGILELPDCARIRRDGSNEVDGIIPDVLVPWRYYDSPVRAAQLLIPVLPEALARARTLFSKRR